MDGDPEIDDKMVTAFFPQAEETGGLFDRIPSDAIWNGKDKPEPEPEPEPEHEMSRSRRYSKRRKTD